MGEEGTPPQSWTASIPAGPEPTWFARRDRGRRRSFAASPGITECGRFPDSRTRRRAGGTYVSSSAEPAAASVMSMVGFAARLGTAAEPVCSSRSARSPRPGRHIGQRQLPGKPTQGPVRLVRAAPLANAGQFVLRDVEELQELLVLVRRGFFELGVPAMHVVFIETGGLHDGHPFIFCNHGNAP